MPLKRWLSSSSLTSVLVAILMIALGYIYVAEVASHPEKSTELLVMVLGTGLAAWAGGWSAFSAERRRREEEEHKSRISAANKALFAAFVMHEAFKNLREYSADANGVRDHPNRALLMNSPQPGMMQAVRFDFDSISYFLDANDDVSAQALLELQNLEWHYAIVLSTVDMRGRAFDELHQAMASHQINNLPLEAIKHTYALQYDRLAALTDQLIATVDDGVKLAQQVDQRLREALAQQFPGQDFLRVNFEPKPAG